MKRILMAAAGIFGLVVAGQPAAAADYRAAAAYNWTGGYLGGTVGILRGKARWSVPGVVATPYSSDTGWLAGLTAGYNWQDGNIVYGIEADWAWSNHEAGPMVACGGGCMTGIDWLATVRGRVGWASDAMMLYLTGGAAFGRIANRFLIAAPAVSGTEAGWTLGGGAEFKLDRNWSAKAEYLYVNLNDTVACSAVVCGVVNNAETSGLHVFRIGVNYTFN